jgi:acetyltransferase-like isoleucine patch superfamily enzyme
MRGAKQIYFINSIVSRLPSHRLRLFLYRTVLGIEIGAGSHVFMGARFEARGNVRIGRNSVINQGCHFDNQGKIVIGDNVSISADAAIVTSDVNVKDPERKPRTRPVEIGDYVVIGTRATVLPGVRVGEGGVVAAGAVVCKDVPPYTFVAGIPAKTTGSRPRGPTYNARYYRFFS